MKRGDADMEKTIEVKNLQKSYKENKVLKDVDFEIQKGEIFALLGSNGAGKTTIVKILSTLLASDGGTAKICGYDVNDNPKKVREKISLTGQFSAVDDILTGKENLVLIAKLRGVAHPEEISDNLLNRFDLGNFANKMVGIYSGGMKRRLDIAMSLIGNPSVIFLDEPTTGLDPEGRQEVWKTIQELSKGGTTILLTTQYLDEAEALADKIAILHDGKILANGTFEELKNIFPPTKKEHIEKQPTLEQIFLAIIKKEKEGK